MSGGMAEERQRWLTVELNSGAGDLLVALRQSRAPVSLELLRSLSTSRMMRRVKSLLCSKKSTLPSLHHQARVQQFRPM